MFEVCCETCPHWELDEVSVDRNKRGFTQVRGLCHEAHDKLPYSITRGGPWTLPHDGVTCPLHPLSKWRKL